MTSNYDNAAFFYDGLSRVVFGDALIKAQIFFLPQIAANSNVLIVGGGTGFILEEIAKVHASGLSIAYVEISSKMTAISRKRDIAGNTVAFINEPVEAVEFPDKFDVIITPFLFDNFKDDGVTRLFGHIHPLLKPGGIWLNTDFQLTGKWWQFVLLKSMLLFFKVLCGVESWRLPDVKCQFDRLRYRLVEEKLFFKDFAVTRIYRK